MDTKELTRLTTQLEMGLLRATKATLMLERLMAPGIEDWKLMDALGYEKAILESVSSDINALNEEIAKALTHREN